MCCDCVTEPEQQLQSNKPSVLTCWNHRSPDRAPAVLLQLFLEVCKGPFASSQTQQHHMWSWQILTSLPKSFPGSCLGGLPVLFSVDKCCYPSCSPQWLFLPYFWNEVFSAEEWTEVRPSTFCPQKVPTAKVTLYLNADPFLSHSSNWAHEYLMGEEKIMSDLISNYYEEECD